MPHRRVPDEQRRFAKRLRAEQTRAESRLWHELRAGRLHGWKFKRQVAIDRYVADFLCFEARLIVEVDGPLHDRTENRMRDAERDARLVGLGFRVLRFKDDVAVATVLREIASALGTVPLPTLR